MTTMPAIKPDRLLGDLYKLRTFGTLLTEEAESGRLPRAHGVASICNVVRQALSGAPPRAVLSVYS